MRERFEAFAARFAERFQGKTVSKGPGTAPPALDQGYWVALQDLFTRDVTSKGIREFLAQDTPDGFRYFAREVDIAALQHLPWYRRYTTVVWRFFLVMAYRLSPPRRILFAAGVPLMGVGWLAFLAAWFATKRGIPPLPTVLLVSSTALFVLLVLELRDKLTLKGDLEVARQIQFGLLPFEPYQNAGWSIRASMRPANTVGGDYFDVIELPEGKLLVLIGDVAGKGMPAALLMALLQSSLHTLITAGLRGGELISKLNLHLCAHIPSNRLITLFCGQIDPSDGTLRYINAGHNPPFLSRRQGLAERLAATSMALGIVPDEQFEPMITPIEVGDRLLLYTDGITEAEDSREEQYGEARLAVCLGRFRGEPQERLLQGLVDDVLDFCRNVRPTDDMTLLVVDRGEQPAESLPRLRAITGEAV